MAKETHSRYNNCLYFCFWLKVALALTFVFSAIGVASWRVYRMRQDKLQWLDYVKSTTLSVNPISFANPGSNSEPSASQTPPKSNDPFPIPQPLTIDPIQCQITNPALARLEPPNHKVYVGFSPDWSKSDLPRNVSTRLDMKFPAIINAFVPMQAGVYDRNMVNWHASETARVNGIFQLTIEPFNMEATSDASLDLLATQCAQINSFYRVPILLRFGHEMNGPWMDFGQKPRLFKIMFIKMTNAIRTKTNMTAMVWAPNHGTRGYPWTPLPIEKIGADSFNLLDTNRDGIIDLNDDPFDAYWPGEEYVDWVGLSAYWYQLQRGPDGRLLDLIPEEGFLVKLITGVDPAIANQQYTNFYSRYAERYNKPMVLAESGAPIVVASHLNTAMEIQIKQNWWRQQWDPKLIMDFPRLKAIVNFEESKFENTAIHDFRMTTNLELVRLFLNDSNSDGRPDFMTWGNQLSYQCNGQVEVKQN